MLKGPRCNLLLLLFLTVQVSPRRLPFCVCRLPPHSPPLLYLPLRCSSFASTPPLGKGSDVLLGMLGAGLRGRVKALSRPIEPRVMLCHWPQNTVCLQKLCKGFSCRRPLLLQLCMVNGCTTQRTTACYHALHRVYSSFLEYKTTSTMALGASPPCQKPSPLLSLSPTYRANWFVEG